MDGNQQAALRRLPTNDGSDAIRVRQERQLLAFEESAIVLDDSGRSSWSDVSGLYQSLVNVGLRGCARIVLEPGWQRGRGLAQDDLLRYCQADSGKDNLHFPIFHFDVGGGRELWSIPR